MRIALPLVAFALVALAAYAPTPPPPASGAAPADTSQWVNLQVLPDTLSRDQMRGLMSGIADALGVKCGHCHVRENDEFVFPSDENPHKEIARDMMRMTWQINRELLPAMEGLEPGEGAMRVTCFTCHRGATRPATAPDSAGVPTEAPGHDHGGHEHD